MTINEAKKSKRLNMIDGAEILRNPSNRKQWFMMIGDKLGKKLMLVDENNHPLISAELEELFDILKSIGINRVEIIL